MRNQLKVLLLYIVLIIKYENNIRLIGIYLIKRENKTWHALSTEPWLPKWCKRTCVLLNPQFTFFVEIESE